MHTNPTEGGTGPPPALVKVLERLDTLERKLDALRTERDPDKLLTEAEAADILGVTSRTLQTERAAGNIRAVRVRGCIRYHRSTVQGYIQRNAEEGSR